MSNARSITPLPPADFTPQLGNYRTLQPFRYWCQKVLPLVYDDSLSYYELLCKVVDYLNKTMEDVETLHGDVTNLHTAYEELQTYVNTYFSSLDVQQEIDNKLDAMASSGALTRLIYPFLPDIVTKWLKENVDPSSAVTLDKSLSIKGSAADAQRTGDIIWAFAPYNDYNILELYYSAEDTVTHGINFMWFNHRCHVYGTSDSDCVCNITPFKSPLPVDIVPGNKYEIKFKTSDTKVGLNIAFYDSNDEATYNHYTTDGEIEVPSTAVAYSARLYVSANTTLDANVTLFGLISKTPYTAMHYLTSITEYDSSNRLTPELMPVNTYFYAAGSRLSGFDTVDSRYYWVWCYSNYYNTNVKLYKIVDWLKQDTVYAFSDDAGATVSFGSDTTQTKIAALESAVYLGKDKTKNFAEGMTYFDGVTDYDSNNRLTPANVPINSYFYSVGSRLSGFQTNESSYYWVWCYTNLHNRASRLYVVCNYTTYEVKYGLTSNSGASIDWGTDTAQTKIAALESAVYLGKDKTKNFAEGMTYFDGVTDYDSNNRLTPANVPINSYFYSNGSRLSGFQTNDSSYYWVWCYTNLHNRASRLYVVTDYYKQNTWYGYTTNSGTTIDWGVGRKDYKILLIGSSFGQDAIEYAPFLMSEMDRKIYVTFGCAYMPGGTFEDYNTYFDNDTAVNYYKKEHTKDLWNNGVKKTLKQVLNDEKWDIILVNQSAY